MSSVNRPSRRPLYQPFRLLLAAYAAAMLVAAQVARASSSDAMPVEAATALSADTAEALRLILDTTDHRGLPFAIVDKREALLTLFDGNGRALARTPVLLGVTPGDDSTPGVGERAQRGRVARDERTTPAGRFEAEPGRNLQGESIVWLDYQAALAIHRLRPGPAKERRVQRLASPRLKDRRVSLGCVVVPTAFFESVIEPVLGRTRSVVYVLPETRPLQTLLLPDATSTTTASR